MDLPVAKVVAPELVVLRLQFAGSVVGYGSEYPKRELVSSAIVLLAHYGVVL